MKTVTMTAKDLHRDMPRFIATLRRGDAVRLTYRGKEVTTIPPKQAIRPQPGSREAMKEMLQLVEKMHVPEHVRNDPRSLKERLAEYRLNDPRYHGRN